MNYCVTNLNKRLWRTLNWLLTFWCCWFSLLDSVECKQWRWNCKKLKLCLIFALLWQRIWQTFPNRGFQYYTGSTNILKLMLRLWTRRVCRPIFWTSGRWKRVNYGTSSKSGDDSSNRYSFRALDKYTVTLASIFNVSVYDLWCLTDQLLRFTNWGV